MKLSIVMPVYNEAGTLDEIVSAVRAVPLDKEIILVDDCSTDGTRQRLVELADETLRVLYHDVNQGKGAALRTGFAAARGEVVIIQDADLEYDPREVPRVTAPILEGRAEVVYGSRFARGFADVRYFRNYLANRVLTTMSNFASGLRLTDMETCYKAFRREVIQAINIEENRFGFEPEVTAKAAAMGVRIREVPISYAGRSVEEGKKIGWRDGLRALWCIAKYNCPCRRGSA